MPSFCLSTCNKLIVLLSLSAAVLTISRSHAETLNGLQSDGWKIQSQATVSGAFKGCNFGLPVPIDGGLIFICSEYNYNYSYRPTFYVMERDGAIKYVIDTDEYEGTLYKGTPLKTYVTGSFEGCEYDKYIPLDNGLLFKCETYNHHYAYHPEVVIVGSYVSIDGEKYDGTLYRR